jgi:hypothetical protein
MLYIGNAFSLGMVPMELLERVRIQVAPDWVNPETMRKLVDEGAVSIIGHESTAKMLGLPFNRQTTRLAEGDILFVCQYRGPRLEERATTVPEGSTFEWVQVEILSGRSTERFASWLSENMRV